LLASASGPAFPSLHRSFQVQPELPTTAIAFLIVALTAEALGVREHITGAALLGKRHDVVVFSVARINPPSLWVNCVLHIALDSAQLAYPTVSIKNRLAGAVFIVRNIK